MSGVLEVLTKARALVARGHCKNKSALDADGRLVHANAPSACSWCTLGAIRAVAPHEDAHVGMEAEDVLRATLGTCMLSRWNDAPRTHSGRGP